MRSTAIRNSSICRPVMSDSLERRPASGSPHNPRLVRILLCHLHQNLTVFTAPRETPCSQYKLTSTRKTSMSPTAARKNIPTFLEKHSSSFNCKTGIDEEKQAIKQATKQKDETNKAYASSPLSPLPFPPSSFPLPFPFHVPFQLALRPFQGYQILCCRSLSPFHQNTPFSPESLESITK